MTESSSAPPPVSPPPASSGSTRKGVAVAQILGAVLLLIVIVFILENTRTVQLRLLVPEVKVSLAVALLIAALLGGVGVLLLQYRHKRKSK